MSQVRIAIIGAGAMGSWFGAHLARAGHQVFLLDPLREHMAAIQERGITVRDESGEWTAGGVTATTNPDALPACDLAIVLTKAHQIREALGSVRQLTASEAVVLVLANGIGCGTAAADKVPAERLLHGATAAGAALEGVGVVRHIVSGSTKFGPYMVGPGAAVAQQMALLLNQAGIEAQSVDRPEGWIWTKLLINIGYNAATSVARVTNGELVRDPDGRDILEDAVREAVAVAEARGVPIGYQDPVDSVVRLGLEVIGANQSTMLQDVLRRRSTEIDFLNGALTREGGAVGVPTPVNATLTRLVRVIERNYDDAASRQPS